jgi:hypothetical protein
MTDRGWLSKGDKVARRSPRKRGGKCDRPFTAPRQVTQPSTNRNKRPDPKDVDPKDKQDSEVQVVTDSEVQQILRRGHANIDSGNSELQIITETENERDVTAKRQRVPETIADTGQETIVSDTTESTPDICRSPVEVVSDTVTLEASKQLGTQIMFKDVPYRGMTFVGETERQDDGSDSDDNVPVAALLRK